MEWVNPEGPGVFSAPEKLLKAIEEAKEYAPKG